MRNIKLVIEYDGTDFAGWQYQPKDRTVQAELEKALKKIFKKPIRVSGAGRTDAGVHALGQVANFKTASNLPAASILAALNRTLPRDILIREAGEVSSSFHARFSAAGKVYQYRIVCGRSALRRNFVWEMKFPVDVGRMRRTLRMFLGRHDFTNFAVGREQENRECAVRKVGIARVENDIVVTIEADRFLTRMARMMVGFVVDIGRGRYPLSAARKMFEPGFDRNHLVAPAQGLSLVSVYYDMEGKGRRVRFLSPHNRD